MKTGLAYPHIVKPPGSEARLEDHPRFRISQIASMHISWGWSSEEIAVNFPELTLPEIYSALAYYHEYRDEIDAEIAAGGNESEEMRRTRDGNPLFRRYRALKQG